MHKNTLERLNKQSKEAHQLLMKSALIETSLWTLIEPCLNSVTDCEEALFHCHSVYLKARIIERCKQLENVKK